jgi:hypothetical protein
MDASGGDLFGTKKGAVLLDQAAVFKRVRHVPLCDVCVPKGRDLKCV